jgi:hypothetical protein
MKLLNTIKIFDLSIVKFVSDYIIPPNEYNSIFIMTNYIETIQTQGDCDEVKWAI